jgi:hypothetical protein
MSQNIKDWSFSAVVALLVGGSMVLAVVDKDYRANFADLAKVGLGGYVGWMMPRANKGEDVGLDRKEEE